MIGLDQAPTQDSLRVVLRHVFDAPEYRWDAPRNWLATVGDWFGRVLQLLGDLQRSHPVAHSVVVAMLAGLLLAILAHMTVVLWRALRPRRRLAHADLVVPSVPRDASWYRTQARLSLEEGRFAEALAYRFRALLLSLERGKVVRFHPAKTPAEYLVESELSDDGGGMLRELVRRLYGHVFGGVPCREPDVLEFDALAARLEESAASR